MSPPHLQRRRVSVRGVKFEHSLYPNHSVLFLVVALTWVQDWNCVVWSEVV